MSHAEKCPVCDGSGKVHSDDTKSAFCMCHGCDGKGWVEVGDSNIPVPYLVPVPTPAPVHPWPWQPVPYKPEWPSIT